MRSVTIAIAGTLGLLIVARTWAQAPPTVTDPGRLSIPYIRNVEATPDRRDQVPPNRLIEAICIGECPPSATSGTPPSRVVTACAPPSTLDRSVNMQMGRQKQFGICSVRHIRRALLRRAAGIRLCATQARAKGENLATEVALSWHIGVDGGAVGSTAKAKGESSGFEPLEACLADQIRHIKYDGPLSSGVCQVDWTVQFQPWDTCRAVEKSEVEVPSGGPP